MAGRFPKGASESCAGPGRRGRRCMRRDWNSIIPPLPPVEFVRVPADMGALLDELARDVAAA